MTRVMLGLRVGPFKKVQPFLKAASTGELIALVVDGSKPVDLATRRRGKTVRGQSLLSANRTRAFDELRYAVAMGHEVTTGELRAAGGRAWAFPALLPGSWHGNPLRSVAAILPAKLNSLAGILMVERVLEEVSA